MIAVFSLLIVLAISMLITRIATAALALTGLSRESARFQARSALTGVGFTTGESESIAHHPVRRRIIMTLMLVSNLGIATVAASLIMTTATTSKASANRKRFIFTDSSRAEKRVSIADVDVGVDAPQHLLRLSVLVLSPGGA